MFLQRQADLNSFDCLCLDDFSYRVFHDVLLFIYAGHSDILRDKPFDLAAGSEAAAAAAAAAVADAAAEANDSDRWRHELLRQLVAAAEKYQIAELKIKAQEELDRVAPNEECE